MYKYFYAIILFVTLFLFLFQSPVLAQIDYPIYVVQQGDTLNSIANRFGVKTEELIRLNNITNPNLLSVGTQLKIPGLEGIKGIVSLENIGVGESLKGLSQKYQLSPEAIIRINKITSPARLFAGATIIIPKPISPYEPHSYHFLPYNQTLLETGIISGNGYWELILQNEFYGPDQFLAGDFLISFGKTGISQSVGKIDPLIDRIEISPLPLIQGKSTIITVSSSKLSNLTGKLATSNLFFWKTKDNQFTALQGIHVQQQPGILMFEIQGKLSDGSIFSYEQNVLLQSGGYGPIENISGVDPKTLDPSVIEEEEKIIRTIVGKITTEKYWSEQFRSPSHFPDIITSYFGKPRTYNGGIYKSFHTGIDYGYGNNLPIYAPAPGKVVFAESTVIRGNATIIDHGWGVFSGFWHQSQFNVKVGDFVQAGQPIGLVGNTGRSTGSHLHWELWVNGIQVDPLDWLKKTYP